MKKSNSFALVTFLLVLCTLVSASQGQTPQASSSQSESVRPAADNASIQAGQPGGKSEGSADRANQPSMVPNEPTEPFVQPIIPPERPKEPYSADAVKGAIRRYIDAQAQSHGGLFLVRDSDLKRVWRLKPGTVSDPVWRYDENGNPAYLACAIFHSMDGADIVDMDARVRPVNKRLRVMEIKIHKVNGKERYAHEMDGMRPIE